MLVQMEPMELTEPKVRRARLVLTVQMEPMEPMVLRDKKEK